ncbi:unnamed protein product [Allacma fusca]|uniref:Uncharacterized protein n=1 Tax=Allacma fusca TaxID=39272 RepID=A0A8J2NNS8_9HEXA|nr:unnamed protein product [Allacma fusca]
MQSDEDFDSILDEDSIVSEVKSLKSARVPTIQELNAQIIKLERENFQLKLRVHMNETRGSIEPITSAAATGPKKSQQEILTEKDVEVLRVEKEQLEFKLHQKHSQLMHEIKLKEDSLQREASLLNKIEEMKNYINICEREKALNRLRQGPASSPYISSPVISGLTITPLKVSKDVGVDVKEIDYIYEDNTAEDAGWYKKYNQVWQTLQSKEEELGQVQMELEILNKDRLQLQKQLKTHDETHERQLLTEQIKALKKEAKELIIANGQLKSELKTMEARMESLKRAANLELSNQLYYHQTALEKVHHEQALLIAELQNLKRACPIQKPVQEFCKKELVDDIDKEAGFSKPLDVTEVLLKPQKLDSLASEEASVCLIDLSTPRFVRPVHNCEDKEEEITLLNKELHEKNSKLALKLKKTRESLKQAISMLEHSEKDKEGMEKIICRQLHRTHMILADVKGALAQSKDNSHNVSASVSPKTTGSKINANVQEPLNV